MISALIAGGAREGEAPMAAKKMAGCHYYISPEGRDTWSGRWKKHRNTWVNGYWAWDWANSKPPPDSLSSASRKHRRRKRSRLSPKIGTETVSALGRVTLPHPEA